MSRADVGRILLVGALLAPLIVFQIGPGYAPRWLSLRLGGVPLTAWATVGWFAAMMLLTWRFAVAANKQASKEVNS